MKTLSITSPPLHPQDIGRDIEVSTAEAKTTGHACTGRILLVDDEAMNLTVLGRRLERTGYTMIYRLSAENIEQVIAEEHIDLVLLDWMMPQRSGLDALLDLRRRYDMQRTPVIIATAVDDDKVLSAALDAGANDYVTKPINTQVLLARVKVQLDHRAAVLELDAIQNGLEKIVDARTQALMLANSALTTQIAQREAAEQQVLEVTSHMMQQERLRAMGQMASGIAHDINNALSPISLYTDSILTMDPDLSPASRGKLEVVRRAIDDAAHTVSRMKDFYRQRDTELDLKPVKTAPLFQQVLDLTQSRWKDVAQERGVEIEMGVELACDLPPILGVESELREALVNLVFNAVDALPNGGRIMLRGRDVENGKLVCIEACDDGVGMDEATLLRCLEPFYTTKGDAGSGLGLAMVYGVVQRHGGDLEIESTLGKGTTIRMTFATADGMETGDGETPVRPLQRLRLLLIDDDPILLRALHDVLGADGHAVTTAGDGGAGISAFQQALAQGKPFDAVITDLGMPKLDGRRVAAAIKQEAPPTPVLLLTGWGERLKVEADAPAHVDRVLSKPPKLRDIRLALTECLDASAEKTGRSS